APAARAPKNATMHKPQCRPDKAAASGKTPERSDASTYGGSPLGRQHQRRAPETRRRQYATTHCFNVWDNTTCNATFTMTPSRDPGELRVFLRDRRHSMPRAPSCSLNSGSQVMPEPPTAAHA